MKSLKYTFFAGLILAGTLASTTSCTEKFDDYNTDQNAAVKVTPAMLATGIILDMTDMGGAKYSVYDNMLNKQIAWAEGSTQSEQYNLLGRVDYGAYLNVTNAQKMVMEAQGSDEKLQNSYKGLAKFVKAYLLYNLSMQVGDIPYSDSNNAEGGVIKPKYDTQKEVMAQVLNDLEEASSLFASGATFDGDPIFGGKVDNWVKTVNTFELNVLINLSHKEGDADLKVKERFAKIASSGKLMTSNNDNFQLVFSNTGSQQYPLYQNNHVQYLMTGSTIVDPLKKFKDYRLFYYAAPADYQLNQGKKASDWDAYMGVDPSASQDENNELKGAGKFSGLNTRYTTAEGEPLMRISYMEQCFLLAEGALRGWIDKSKADDYYKAGIRASMEFIAEHTPDNEDYNHDHPITADYIAQYLEQSDIQLNGDFNHDLEQVLLQKYLGSYLQHPNNECFYDNRRTGYPVLPLNPSTNENTDASKLPVRWLYPQAELDYNSDNVKEALNRQYKGSDDYNEIMWILQ